MRSNTLLLIAMAAVSASAQDIISARAGLIHFMEGSVLINGESIEQKGDTFLSMKQGDTLSTERGRAEVLLNAGTYLRIGEASSFKLVSADLDNTQLTLVSGTVLVEVAELPKDTSATMEILGSQVALKKRGLYEFSAEGPGHVRVYDGELALTASGATPIKVTKGREIAFNALSAGPGKFDETQTSELYNWGSRRAIYIAQANQSAARTAYANGSYGQSTQSLLTSSSLYRGTWIYSPIYGMYTYLPATGFGYSPFGIQLYSPRTVYVQQVQTVSSGANAGGQNSGAGRSSVQSSAYSNPGMSSAPAAVSAPVSAPSAPASSPNAGGGGGRRR